MHVHVITNDDTIYGRVCILGDVETWIQGDSLCASTRRYRGIIPCTNNYFGRKLHGIKVMLVCSRFCFVTKLEASFRLKLNAVILKK